MNYLHARRLDYSDSSRVYIALHKIDETPPPIRILAYLLPDIDYAPSEKQGRYNSDLLYPSNVDRQRFKMLVEQWSQDTLFMSSVSDMIDNPAYQEIIEMGRPIVPLLLKELELRPDHWFAALSSITGEDPIPVELRGNFKKMVDAWLEWGRLEGYTD